jgi:hypothetical protein
MRTPPGDPAHIGGVQRRGNPRELDVETRRASLAAPAPGRLDAWAERVHAALVELSADP